MVKTFQSACIAALVILCFAAYTADAAVAGGKCSVVSFKDISGIIGPLRMTASRFMPYGDNPKVGFWVCTASSRNATVTVQAGCNLPYVKNLFVSYALGAGKAKGQTWQKVHGVGDQAWLVTDTKPDNLLGRSAGLSVESGRTLFIVTGSVGNPQNISSLKPMPAEKLVKLARKLLDFKCS